MIKKTRKRTKTNLTNKHLHAYLSKKYFPTTSKLITCHFKMEQFLA